MDWHQDTHSELLQQEVDEGQVGLTQLTAAAGRLTRAVAARARANRNIPIFFVMTLPLYPRGGRSVARSYSLEEIHSAFKTGAFRCSRQSEPPAGTLAGAADFTLRPL